MPEQVIVFFEGIITGAISSSLILIVCKKLGLLK